MMGVTFSFPLTHEWRLTLGGSRVPMVDLILRPRTVEIYEEVIKQMRVVCLKKILNFNQNCVDVNLNESKYSNWSGNNY